MHFLTKASHRFTTKTDAVRIMPTLEALRDFVLGLLTYFSKNRVDHSCCNHKQINAFVGAFYEADLKCDKKLCRDGGCFGLPLSNCKAETIAQNFILLFPFKSSLLNSDWSDSCLESPRLIRDILSVVSLSSPKSPELTALLQEALMVLSVLSRNDWNKEFVRKTGGIRILIASIDPYLDNPSVLYCLCRVIRNLAMSERIEKSIGTDGGIKAVLKAMTSHPDHVALQEQGSWVLTNVSCDTDNKALVREAGGLQVMVDLMARHRDCMKVQEAVAWAMANITCKDEDNIHALGGLDCIPRIFSAMQTHDRESSFLRGALRTLENIATLDANAKLIGDNNGVKTILDIANKTMDEQSVQKHTLRTLSDFVWTKKNFEDFCKYDGVQYVLRTLNTFDSDEDVLEAGCIVFYDCLNSADSAYHNLLTEHRVIDILSSIARKTRSRNHKSVFKTISLALKALCRQDKRHLLRYKQILTDLLDGHELFNGLPIELVKLITEFTPVYPFTH